MNSKIKFIIEASILLIIGGIASAIVYNIATKEKIESYIEITSLQEVLEENSNKTISVTFGRSGCSWCNKFKPILTEIASEKQVKLYYIDNTNLVDDDNFIIPLKCADKANQTLLDGFGTPLTLIFKNKEVVDCASGYKEAMAFKSILRNNEIIK